MTNTEFEMVTKDLIMLRDRIHHLRKSVAWMLVLFGIQGFVNALFYFRLLH